MTISDVYDICPMSTKALWKRLSQGPIAPGIRLLNDMGAMHEFRVLRDDTPIGVIVYHGGRKLVCHGITQAAK